MKKNTNSNMPEENGIYAGTSDRIIITEEMKTC